MDLSVEPTLTLNWMEICLVCDYAQLLAHFLALL